MSTYALGVMVSAETLYGVLLEKTEEGTVVRYKTSRGGTDRSDADLPFDEPSDPMSGVEDEPDDVTIQFGEQGGDDDLFMGSEFEEVENEGDEVTSSSGSSPSWNFQAQLEDLLDECAEQGFEDPEIAFCETTAEIDEVELRLPIDESEEQSEGNQGVPLEASTSTLMEMLEEQYEGTATEERVGFLPMRRTGDGRQRVLALISRPGGAVLSTLSRIQDQTLARTPRVRLLDAEISLYLGLTRSVLQLPPETPEKTILVRSGPDDTLVLFIEGNTLRQSEYLPELTSEDSAETICSRVLLLQDEYGMGEVQHVMLVAEENEEALADAFKSYFASANLRLLRTHLPNGDETDEGAYVGATGAALRLLDDPDYEPFFQQVNLLPKGYTASRFRLPVGWSVPLLLALLAVTTLGFVWYYFMNARAINDRQAELRALEQQIAEVDTTVLQRRIDSVEAATAQYAGGLQVVDRLLQGSNKWSLGLATVTGEANRISGLSFDQWSPVSDTSVSISGRSNDRTRVVRLAQAMDGEIENLAFTETRDVSLYNFVITVPLDTTKPEAVQYWRQQQLAEAASDTASDTTTLATTNPSSDTVPEQSSGSVTASVTSSTSSTAEASSGEEAWTVVVASLAGGEAAEQVADTYRNRLTGADYSIQVQQSPENGRYRVGIGVFSSFDAARSALQEMRENVPDESWLHQYSVDAEEASSTSGTAGEMLQSGL